MITVIGSLNMDLVTKVKKMPRVGETLIGYDFNQIPGGKGANQADAVAKLGTKVSMIGRVGNDAFGNALIKALENDGGNTKHVYKTDGVPTGIAVILVNDEGENSIVVVPGANFQLSPQDIDKATKAIEDSKIVVAQLETPMETIKYSFKLAKELGKYTILNPAPAAKLDDDLIGNVDLLTPNETELEVISGIQINSKEDILTASRSLIEKGLKEVIVTLGDKGCLYINKSENEFYSAHKVKAIDTTAAGDSFTAAIAVALAEGKKIGDAIEFATVVGALTVTKHGAQSSLPYLEDVEKYKSDKSL